jgi:hypothetical protein
MRILRRQANGANRIVGRVLHQPRDEFPTNPFSTMRFFNMNVCQVAECRRVGDDSSESDLLGPRNIVGTNANAIRERFFQYVAPNVWTPISPA